MFLRKEQEKALPAQANGHIPAPHARGTRRRGHYTSLVLFIGVSQPCSTAMNAVLAQGENCFCGARPSGAGQACPTQARSDGALPSPGSRERSCTQLRLLFRLLHVHHQHLAGMPSWASALLRTSGWERSHHVPMSSTGWVACPACNWGMPRA